MTLTSIINTMTEVVTLAVPMLLVLLVFYWNISQIIFTANNPEKRKQALPRLLWSIVALVVIFSLGGLINIISNTLLGSSSGSNTLPAATSGVGSASLPLPGTGSTGVGSTGSSPTFPPTGTTGSTGATTGSHGTQGSTPGGTTNTSPPRSSPSGGSTVEP